MLSIEQVKELLSKVDTLKGDLSEAERQFLKDAIKVLAYAGYQVRL